MFFIFILQYTLLLSDSRQRSTRGCGRRARNRKRTRQRDSKGCCRPYQVSIRAHHCQDKVCIASPSYLLSSSLPLFLSSFSSYPSLLILIHRSSLIRNDSRRVLPEGKGGSPSMSVAKKALDDAEQSERAVELIFEELMVFHLLSITSFLCLSSLLHPPFLYLSPAHHSSCLF